MKLLCLWLRSIFVTFLSKRLKFKHQLPKQYKNNFLVRNWRLFQSFVRVLWYGRWFSLALYPAAKVGHIGMYFDEETLEPVEYLVKLIEDIDQRQIRSRPNVCDWVVQQSWQ